MTLLRNRPAQAGVSPVVKPGPGRRACASAGGPALTRPKGPALRHSKGWLVLLFYACALAAPWACRDAWSQAASPPAESLGPSSRRTALVFSEIHYKPLIRPDGKVLEFLELFNSSPLDEDLGGYRISGEIEFEFRTNTIIRGGGFLVVAQSAADVQSVYGLSGVLQYGGANYVTNLVSGTVTTNLGSLGGSGTLQLRNAQGAILLTVSYSNEPPWPAAANGAGHSLVLAAPSYGEVDPRAWAASDLIGGSPGRPETRTNDTLRNIVINEFLVRPATGTQTYIELYNHGNGVVNLSGAWLSDDPATNKYRIGDGTLIPPRAFLSFPETALRFAPNASGGTLLLVNSNRSRVVDAVRYGGQAIGVSWGRLPNGGPELYPLATPTPGGSNGVARLSPVVLNEVMFGPPSGDAEEEFVEIHNRGTSPVSLGGWQLQGGIQYEFPANASVAADSYLVVARNVTNLFTRFGRSLTCSNLVGDFRGKLANEGDRVALASPEQVITTSSSGKLSTNTAFFTADEVTYRRGGRWGKWTERGGSSLELIDARSRHRQAADWADSAEPTNSAWQTVSRRDYLDPGAGPVDRLELLLLGEGECLVDSVRVTAGAVATNLPLNGSFESGTEGWVFEGNHSRSGWEPNAGFDSPGSLRLVASGPGDTVANRAYAPLTAELPLDALIQIRARVRWLRGSPEVLLRLRGNYLEAQERLNLPFKLGTPGAPNSRASTNAGPAIGSLLHTPAVPAPGQPVVVTARVEDPDGLAALRLVYRLDPAPDPLVAPMADDGTGGDAVAGDGIYSGTIPGQIQGALVAFYVEATDRAASPATARFPANAPAEECLVRFGDPMITNSVFGTYRLWLTRKSLDAWQNRPALSKEPVDATFVYGAQRVIYNVKARYASAPFRHDFDSPLGKPCDYWLQFPPDEPFLGTTQLDKLRAPGAVPGDDDTLQRSQLANWMARELGLPWHHQRYVRYFVNGARRGELMEDAQAVDADFIAEWFGPETQGDLFELAPWLEAGEAPGSVTNYSWSALSRYARAGGEQLLQRYRWTWLPRVVEDLAAAYQNLFRLTGAASARRGTAYAALREHTKTEEWGRLFALQHALGNVDSFGHQNSHNTFAFFIQPDFLPRLVDGRPSPQGLWRLLAGDFDKALGAPGSAGPIDDELFASDPADAAMLELYAQPGFRREMLRAFRELAEGPLRPDRAAPWLEARYALFRAEGLAAGSPAALAAWIAARRNYLLDRSNFSATFGVLGEINYVTQLNHLVMEGTAPLDVATIRVNGVDDALTWNTETSWSLNLFLRTGLNHFVLQGYDRFGQPIAGATATLDVTCAQAVSRPEGNVVINEIMYNPIESGASFLELYNRSAQSSFDLSGWRVDGARFVFPPGTVIEPNGFVTIVKDRTIFAQVYGDYVPVAGQFAGGLDNVGEALTLLIPGRVPSQNVVIDKVRYESALPWPSFAAGGGAALQLVDSGQDNSRVASWSDGYTNLPPGVSGPELATPGRSNSVSGTLPPFPPLWLNEAQAENTRGLTTQAGQRGPWIELFNSGTNALELAGFYLSDNFAGLTRWAFPAGSTVGPGQFVIVWADGEPGLSTASEWHTDFRLSPTNGAIFLARLLAGQPQLLDYLNYTDLKPDFSYGSFPDGQVTDREVFSFVTAGRSNSVPALVFINEWMASNLAFLEDEADSDFEDWIELYNGTGHPLDLSGYYLTDTLTNATQWRVPDGTVIDPHGYLLVWADGEPAQASLVTADLHANFQLSRNGETIGLFSPDLKLVDTISFGPQSNNVSQGRSPDGSTNIITLTLPTPRGPNYTRPPSLPAPPPSVIVPGQPNRLALLDPPGSLGLGTFMLEPGAPPGLTLDPVLGILTWTPPSDQPPGNYVVTLCFCDVRGVTVCGTLTLVIPEFKLSILGIVPLPDGNIRLQGESQPGRTHSMQFLDDLGSGTWVNWQDSFIPATTPFFITVPPGANGHRFYRLLRY